MIPSTRTSRRALLALGTAATIAAATACGDDGGTQPTGGSGRLSARVAAPTGTIAPGFTQLQLGSGRDGFIWVPESYDPATPAPLLLLLHGAGRTSQDWAQAPLEDVFGRKGIVIVAPDSRRGTWDRMLTGFFTDDVTFIDAALTLAFSRVNVDPARVAIGGFSDGGSYALSLGLTNGDLFSAIMAFSPGYVAAGSLVGRPQVFDSHGTTDAVLPIGQTSRQIVPWLEAQGYEVNYVEFDGGHTLPRAIADQAVDWWLPGD